METKEVIFYIILIMLILSATILPHQNSKEIFNIKEDLRVYFKEIEEQRLWRKLEDSKKGTDNPPD